MFHHLLVELNSELCALLLKLVLGMDVFLVLCGDLLAHDLVPLSVRHTRAFANSHRHYYFGDVFVALAFAEGVRGRSECVLAVEGATSRVNARGSVRLQFVVFFKVLVDGLVGRGSARRRHWLVVFPMIFHDLT